MTLAHDRYIARARTLAPWLWHLAYPVRTWRNRVALHLWWALMKVHRMAWVRGVEL